MAEFPSGNLPVTMTENRWSPLAHWAERFATLPAEITVREVPNRTELNLQLFARTVPSSVDLGRFGIELPEIPCTFTSSDAGQALWLGPCEWLLARSAPGVDVLAQAVAGSGTVIDVSAQRTTLRLSGSAVLDVLAQGCAIDLDPAVSPPGTCVQTMLARANVILTVLDPESNPPVGDALAAGQPVFEVRVRSSFADYLAAWLVDAARDVVI